MCIKKKDRNISISGSMWKRPEALMDSHNYWKIGALPISVIAALGV